MGIRWTLSGSQLHMENGESGPVGENTGNCQNTGNLYAQPVNFLILTVQDIVIFAAKLLNFF